MTAERQKLEAVIQTLEAERLLLGDAVVEAAVVPLRAKLAALAPQEPDAMTAADQTLRLVTVLFLDVVGSTALGVWAADVLMARLVEATQTAWGRLRYRLTLGWR